MWIWFATSSSFPSREPRRGVSKAASHTQHQPEIWVRPVALNSTQQQYKHLPKPVPGFVSEVMVGDRFVQTSNGDTSVAPRDYVLASGPCTALGIICATLWVRSQPNQRMLCEKYTVDRAPPGKIKPNQENQETGQAGSSCSAAKWGSPPSNRTMVRFVPSFPSSAWAKLGSRRGSRCVVRSRAGVFYSFPKGSPSPTQTT